LEASQCGVNFGRERLGVGPVRFAFGPVQNRDPDVGETVFSEKAVQLFDTTHGDVPKCFLN
jgi:hypothetical protein